MAQVTVVRLSSMYYLLSFLAALVIPHGRLSQVPFAFLAIVLALGHVWVFLKITQSGEGLQWNVYTIALFCMLWMQFCIFTRRSRDCGSSGIVYVLVLFLAVFTFLLAIDPEFMWPDASNSYFGELVMKWGLRFLRMLYIALFLWGIAQVGEEGPNAFGPEFGEQVDRGLTAATSGYRPQTPEHVRRFGQLSKTAPKWGQRRRTGFGRR
ncbi:MAG: DUF805 domain-containing protein [Pseudomonadota bacterium]